MRNPFKQASVLLINLKKWYNIRNGFVMFYFFDVSLVNDPHPKNKGKNNKR